MQLRTPLLTATSSVNSLEPGVDPSSMMVWIARVVTDPTAWPVRPAQSYRSDASRGRIAQSNNFATWETFSETLSLGTVPSLTFHCRQSGPSLAAGLSLDNSALCKSFLPQHTSHKFRTVCRPSGHPPQYGYQRHVGPLSPVLQRSHLCQGAALVSLWFLYSLENLVQRAQRQPHAFDQLPTGACAKPTLADCQVRA